MLELIFQGFMEWAYGLALECWEYFSSSLLDIMSMDYAYMKSHVPVMVSIAQVLLAVGWALLIGNLVFQALKSMAVGLGFEGEDPKLLFTRTFVFAFLLMASPQICEVGLSLTAGIIELLEIPDAINVTLVDEGVFGSLGAAWLLVIIFGLIIMLKVLSSQRTWTGRTLSPQTWVKIKPACWQSGIPLCLEWRQSMFPALLKSCRI